MPDILKLEEARSLREHITDELTSIDRKPTLKKSQALEAARACVERLPLMAKLDITADKLRYLVDQKLVHPATSAGEERTPHLYGRDQLVDIVFTSYVREHHNMTLSQIAALLRDLDAKRTSSPTNLPPYEVRLPQHRQRGSFTIRSRIVSVVLHQFLGPYKLPSFWVHLRKEPIRDHRHAHPKTVHISRDWLELEALEQQIYRIRDEDIFGWVSPDGEVLFSGFEVTDLVDLWRKGHTHWLGIQVYVPEAKECYDITLGFRAEDVVDHFEYPANECGLATLALLLHILFIEPDLARPAITPAEDASDYSTLLQTLAEFVPHIADHWEYCAVLTPSEKPPPHLRIVATSARFPAEMEEETLVWHGQPVSGWVFAWNSRMIIQHTFGDYDPRIARQEAEKTSAAIGLPTRVHGKPNGVLYVGTRKIVDGDVFREAEIRVLLIFADLIGETIDRNRARMEARTRAKSIIDTVPFQEFAWIRLEPRLSTLVLALRAETVPPQKNENMQVIAAQVKVPPLLQRTYPEFGAWMINHAIATTREFFEATGEADWMSAEFYTRQSEQSSEFVCLFPRREITDVHDRELREDLRKLLNSLRVTYAFDGTYQIPVHVWSMPFRLYRFYRELQLADNRSEEAARISRKLLHEIESSMDVLVHIETAHYLEHQGDIQGAIRELMPAYYLAPASTYILRHIAKYHAALGEHAHAVTWWYRLLALEDDHKHHRRLGYSLARLRQFDKAEEAYVQACAIDPKDVEIMADTLIEFGDFFLVRGAPFKALEKYQEAAKLRSDDVSDLLWLRIARAELGCGNRSEAQMYANLVLKKRPDDLDAKALAFEASSDSTNQTVGVP
jgi:tetratricopeptide (TPR) repeat protein/GAF domain-containing protein/DNA-binding transcriptional MerR regulator